MSTVLPLRSVLPVVAGLVGYLSTWAQAGPDVPLTPRFTYDEAMGQARAWLPGMDMSASVSETGFSLFGPVHAPEWRTHFRVLGTTRGQYQKTWSATRVQVEDARLEWSSDEIAVEYLIGDEGLRQNFILKKRPHGIGPLSLNIAVNSSLCAEEESATSVAFLAGDGHARHTYSDLKVWDACGSELNASMRWSSAGDILALIVDDRSANYPITIDPVSATANRTLTPPIGGHFGYSVASAGDLNGDGYTDVAVGAYSATSGEANEGLVYIYYGSSAGIPAAPSVTLQADQAGANFGISVDGAGDVNNDGYGDLVVGASTWESSVAEDKEGAVFIYHGSAAGLNVTPARILQSNKANMYMGSCVAGLGDINGDGFSDIGIGGFVACFPGTNCNEGIAWVYLGSATGIPGAERHRLDRDWPTAQFGASIAPAGDVNGDGFSDVIIGAHKYDLGPCVDLTCDDGAVFIYHGSANALGAGLNPAPTTVFNTVGYSQRAGWAVSTAGDVNGDGYSDIIIGDWRDQIGPEASEGTAFIYHGSASGINTVPATILQSNVATSYFGRSVSTAGDVNGDGYADVIVGCIQFSGGQTYEGAAFIYLGSPTGVSSSAFLRYEPNATNAGMGESVSTAGDVNGDGYSDMIVGAPGQGRAYVYHGGTYNVNATPSFTRSSGMAAARMGAAVANAGDVNGDGYSDAIIGSPDASNGQANEGLVHVHYGGLNGLSASPDRTLEVNIAGAAFGASVASAGDVNGDGYADVIVGAPTSGGMGRAYVFHGGPGGLSATPSLTLNGTPGSLFGTSVFKAGDHNADGYSDVLIGAPGSGVVHVHAGGPSGLDPTPVVFNAPVAGSSFGASVCTAGDVNGDGFSDMIVGAPDLSNGQAQEGAFYVYQGALITLPTSPILAYESNTAGRRLGTAVAGIGDVNGDGHYDIAAGAPFASNPEVNEGIIYIFYGAGVPAGFSGSTTIEGNLVGARAGTSLAEAGDVNGDGYADLIVGGPGVSNGEAGEGRAWVYLGSPGGITAANNTALEPNIANEAFGTAVAGGGDVDGDGYSDVLCGSPGASPTLANEGTVRLYRGNNAQAYNRLTRQYMVDLTSPLATNSMDLDDHYYFGIGHRARSNIQRTTARLRWEVVHEGQPFSGTPITNSVNSTATGATYTNLGLAGVELKEIVAKIPSRFRNRWRVRVEYPLHNSVDGQRFSRWFYGYASGVGDIGVLPVELMSFTGTAEKEFNELTWITASERNSAFFLIERSIDGQDFEPIGTVDAAAHSLAVIRYQFTDANARPGLSYYRLRMVDNDGSEELSNIIVLTRDNRSTVVYPVPVNDVLFWSPQEKNVIRAVIHDALGRTVAHAATQGDMLTGGVLEQLATGSYSLLLLDADGELIARSRFIKR